MKRTICLLFALVSAAAAQTQFEVASIRPSGPDCVRGWDGGPGHKDPTRYTFGQATMHDLISTAWGVSYFQVSSSVPLDRDKFDLAAKVPEGATKEQFRVMMQNMLKERFGLNFHLESRDFPAYELVIAKGGLKLKEGVPGGIILPENSGLPAFPPNVARAMSNMSGSGGYTLMRVKIQLEPMSVVATSLQTSDNLPIVDETGLTGKYSFTLEYTMDQPGSTPDAPPVVPSVFTALQQQLGLQLVQKKLPFDVRGRRVVQ